MVEGSSKVNAADGSEEGAEHSVVEADHKSAHETHKGEDDHEELKEVHSSTRFNSLMNRP